MQCHRGLCRDTTYSTAAQALSLIADKCPVNLSRCTQALVFLGYVKPRTSHISDTLLRTLGLNFVNLSIYF